MGKDFILVRQNGLNINKAFSILKQKEVIESSFSTMNFKGLMKNIKTNDIGEIRIGVDGTKESVIDLIDGNYIVVKGTIKKIDRIR